MKLLKLIPLGILVSTLWSCQTEETISETTANLPDETSAIEFKNLMGNEVPVLKQEDGTFLIGGKGSDIVAFEENFDGENPAINPIPELPGRSALILGETGSVRKWPNNTVIYRIGNINSRVKARFEQAMQEWSSKTAVKFKERTTENYYVTVNATGDNCNCGVATIGVFDTRGFIQLGTNVSVDIIVHEIGHTLGFLHEQNRADRDETVQVLFNNIKNGAERQFFISENSIPLTEELDINSIMMYGSFTFSKDGRSPTIVDLNGNTYRKNAPGLSQGDIEGTNQAYPPTDQEEESNNDEEADEESTDTDENTDTEDETNDDTNTDTEDETDTETDEVTSTDDSTKTSICSGINEYSRNTQYRVGDRVTFRGFLYQRDFTRWLFLGSCETLQEANICEGISPYNRFLRYNVGSQVTYLGNLYRRVANGWILEGACSN